MKSNKAFHWFARSIAHAPEDAQLTVGLTWDEREGWRVLIQFHGVGTTTVVMVSPAQARNLADTYDEMHRGEWAGQATGAEWVAGDLRKLAGQADGKNAVSIVPEGYIEVAAPRGEA